MEGIGIAAYDEVILCNCSCYGPIYPFTEMFDEFGKRDVDFWGITEWPLNTGNYHGTWVLSYFMVFRPHLFLSPEWKYYWENLSPVYSREECIDKHETKFTAYFAEKGFTYDVYCPNTPGYMDPTIEAPDQLVEQQRCPIIKRKVFCTDYGRFLQYGRGNASGVCSTMLKRTVFLTPSRFWTICLQHSTARISRIVCSCIMCCRLIVRAGIRM
jgi:rhamnosyltransferase